MRIIVMSVLFLTLVDTGDAQDNNSAQDGSEDQQIWFIFPDRESSEFSGDWVNNANIRSGRSSFDGRTFSEVGIAPDIIATEFTDFIEQLGPILSPVSSITEGIVEEYQIDQIELSVSITAEGKVGIIATATVGGHAGIRLIFRRR